MGGRWGINHCPTAGVRVGQEENGYKASEIFSCFRPTNWFEIYFLATGVACFLILAKTYTIPYQIQFFTAGPYQPSQIKVVAFTRISDLHIAETLNSCLH